MMCIEKLCRNSLAAVTLLTLFACAAVGPDYVRPTAPVPVAFKENDGWKVAKPGGTRIGGNWWLMFDDPQLTALEEQVVISNQNVLAAEAQVRQARALVQAARSAYFPSFGTSPSVTRGLSPLAQTGTNNLYSLPFDFSWEVDVWGKVRRNVEANSASAQASEADLAAVRLSAQGQLGQDYFLLRSQDAQQELLDATVAAYQKALEITRNQYASGVAGEADVLLAETQLKTAQAQAIDLGVQRAQLEHAIALLIGKPASEFSLAKVHLAAVFPAIPAALPSELLERRPDIAASERLMAAANAQIGVAQAAYYPSLQLSASAGMEAYALAKWLTWPARFWSLGSTVSETLYDGGLRKAQSDQARGAYDQTVASYRQTVLTGFQQVEDNLATLRILEREAKAQEEAVKASQKSLTVTRNQYLAGTVSYLTVVIAQSTELANEKNALSIQSGRLTACVLLIEALGGGWDASLLSDSSPRVLVKAPDAHL